ncbi:MAG: methylenetetrahydrofolate reductase [NAD(P)H] [Syntrophales bacterium]|jgi:methylenetetrahydrofolate reductase (NADPH)|nr:methylenetetrahydrofolate reductase [NAD(P)H] [Syntrophales bacterium]MCK9527052.1 methylenetetrahydrofolate reductase [NAD(P)H] [Syntrophales bacterium]MDX9921823.1 methylenetetrahydrofolate reductase [NAD(P)H] [Syntrophales bacterium]
MKIKDLFDRRDCLVSFEVFPPVRDGTIDHLVPVINELVELKPDFMSVTYGAGGTSRDMTVEIAALMKEYGSTEVMAHLTCVGYSRLGIDGVLQELKSKGIRNILALRGDPPDGQECFIKPEEGFGYASELVEFIGTYDYFCVGVAGYPEGHIEAPSFEEDIINLKKKVDSGSDFIITQLFFSNEDFYRFRDAAQAAGVDVPIVPGIFPILNYRQIQRLTALCGATLPSDLHKAMQAVQDKNDEVARIGMDYAICQSRDLLEQGVPGLHFYSMNRSGPVKEILRHLSIPGRTET